MTGKKRGNRIAAALNVASLLLSTALSAGDEMRFQRWVHWASARGWPVIPADPGHMAFFMDHIHRRGVTFGTILKYIRAIDRKHEGMGLNSLSSNRDIQNLINGYRRKLGIAPRRTDQALTASRFERIRATAYPPTGDETVNEAAVRARTTIAMIAIMRDAMLYALEPKSLRWRDISCLSDGTSEVRVTTRNGDLIVRSLSVETMSYLGDVRSGSPGPDDDHLIPGREFRLHPHTLVRDAAERAGLGTDYSAWSPRTGMAVDLLLGGATELAVMSQGRWPTRNKLPRSVKKVLLRRGGVANYYERDRGPDG